ncbi:MAG TPA: hypothetical protein IAA93_01100 [Candidatus Avibacteroides avistercoris]|uniref:Uncharacterized protein n=1 Tax=Candidatus Avibacteroides avistercoris TaxID=2840690 RepID=A0A9D2UGY1_9BACT|nr:hypothetical protein [Candidatus Avibacteroides avistercoris]
MYKLIFPNGSEQTFKSWMELERAAQLLGGRPKQISGTTYAFVPNK